jgi:hypothetical protein
MRRSHADPHRVIRSARAGIRANICAAIIAALSVLATTPVSPCAQGEQQGNGIVVIPLDPPGSPADTVAPGSSDTAGETAARDATPATPDDSAQVPSVTQPDTIGADDELGQSAPPPDVILEIASIPSGASLYIDGEYRGETPYIDSHMTAGVHEIALELDDYKPFGRKMSFLAHTHKRLNIRMFSLAGTVSIFSNPSGAVVSIDDSAYGATPLHAQRLEKGAYALRLSREDYVPHSDSIFVRRNAHDTLTFVLQSIRYADSVARARRTRGQWARRIVFGGIAGAFGAAGYAANQDVRESIEEEQARYKRYQRESLTASEYEERWSAYQSARATTDTSMRRRTIFYIAGGVFAAAFAVSIPF